MSTKKSQKKAVSSNDCININLVFTGNYTKKYYPMRVTIPLNSTIDDVINIIRTKNNINEKIIINYKKEETMKPLESTRTINEIKDLIQEEGPKNKILNIMYITNEDNYSIKNMTKYSKTFKYSIPELSIQSQNIYINNYSMKSTDDLKKKIADDLKIPNECIQIDNSPSSDLENVNRFNKKILPESLVIFDNDKNRIEGSDKPLYKIQQINNDFFYKISDSPEQKTDKIIDKHPIIKKFLYTIRELSIHSNEIEIDLNECKSINDLKKKIASKHNISDEQLQFLNVSNLLDLKSIDYSYIFFLKFTNPNPCANILIPGGKAITIKDCYKMNFDEIIEYLGIEGFYYSQQCIRANIHLYLSGEEIPREGFHLLSMRQNTKLELRIAGNSITLNYDGKQFTFSENEDYYEALNLVKKVFKYDNVSIQDDSGKQISKLISTNEYHIRVEVQAVFFPIKRYSCLIIKIDLLETVADVKKKIAKKINFEHQLENLIIFDKNEKPIADLDKPLSSVQNLKKYFYYSIEMKNSKSVEKKESRSIITPEMKTFKYSINELSIYKKSIESKDKILPIKDDDEHEKDIKLEYKESDESPIKQTLSSRKPFSAKDSDTDTSSSEDDYSKKCTPISKGKDWSPKTKQEREDFERNPIKKHTPSFYKETPEKKPSLLEGILPEEEGIGQIQKKAQKKRSSSISRNKFKPKIIPLSTSKKEKTEVEDKKNAKEIDENTKPDSDVLSKSMRKSRKEKVKDDDKRKPKEIDDTKEYDFNIMNKTMKGSRKEKTEDEGERNAKEIDKTKKPDSDIMNESMKESKKEKAEVEDKKNAKEIDENMKPDSDVLSKSMRRITDSRNNERASSKLSTGAGKNEDNNSSNKMETVKKGSQSRRSSSVYKFKFKGELFKIELPNDSTIESQENYIKNELKIEPNQQITFRFIINDVEDDEEMITDTQQAMKEFQKGTIRIALKHKVI